jgi:hypothetical protein
MLWCREHTFACSCAEVEQVGHAAGKVGRATALNLAARHAISHTAANRILDLGQRLAAAQIKTYPSLVDCCIGEGSILFRLQESENMLPSATAVVYCLKKETSSK